MKDRYQRIVARVKCAGVNANAEQVNRGMAWVYRRYAKDHDLYVLEHGAKVEKRGYGLILLLLHLGNGEKTAMCGRFEQSETPRYYADALSAHISEQLKTLGDNSPSYNVAPGQRPWMIMLHDGELLFIGMPWGYRTPKEAAEKKKPWICARVEKSLTGSYFRHMFSEGRVIIPAGGWYEWTLENGKKQPWYITRKANEPIFMAGLTNFGRMSSRRSKQVS